MHQLKRSDLLALGFMTFALFLGAGNIIFPPDVGRTAGEAVWPAAFGFLSTGVGLPLLGVVAAAIIGGGLSDITQPLPRWGAVIFGLSIYLSIGPLFAIPRTATVAYEIGADPFIPGDSALGLALYIVVFFIISTLLALSPGKLMDRVGKWITPALIAVLAIMAIAVLVDPQGPVGHRDAELSGSAFGFGFLEGYQTMDTLASVVFGIVIIQAIRDKGITERAQITRYTLIAGFIAALCLSLVYLPLAWLGATSHTIAPHVANGGEMIALYIQGIFGAWGQVMLAIVISLACLTTAVGLLTCCGEYLHQLIPRLPYKPTVIVLAVFSALIANQGLSTIIQFSIPVLVALYPLTMVLIGLSLIKPWLRDPERVYRIALGLTFLISLYDGLKQAGVEMGSLTHYYQQLPLASAGIAWSLPAALGLLLGLLMQRRHSELDQAQSSQV